MTTASRSLATAPINGALRERLALHSYTTNRDTTNRSIRNAVLGQRQLAATLVIAGIYDERWLIEIEATAAG